MNTYEKEYKDLVYKVLDEGSERTGRNGKTKSLFGQTLRADLAEGFPALTGRRMFLAGVFGEMLAFIRGAEDLATFKELGCNYWVANAEAWPANKGRSTEDMQIGQYVGSLWRNFKTTEEHYSGADQLAELVGNLQKDPYSRRHVLSAWHPEGVACIPPCTIMAVFNVQNSKLNCHVTMRSADLMLGVPSDMAGYALLMHLLAQEVKLELGTLMMTFVDAHIYASHLVPADEYLCRSTMHLPRLDVSSAPSILSNSIVPADIKLLHYECNEPIHFTFEV